MVSTTPRHPIYIVSKGRWESRLTSKALHAMGVPHYVVVEETEAEMYSKFLDNSANILILGREYQREYDTCDDLGDTKSKGPGPARNFAWDDSIQRGYDWHWVMDDNIRMFIRQNRNFKVPVADGTVLKAMEDFCDRYSNLAMAGPNYHYFVPRKIKQPPYVLNTRIYSCNLIRNDTPYRWRGRYNEDTDLSLRMLKDKWCTVLFKAFLQDKTTTQVMKGGNTDEFYAHEGTLPKSKMQVDLHPDVSRLAWRFNRWHHYVNYAKFKRNHLKRRPDYKIDSAIDEYGMKFQFRIENEWVDKPLGSAQNAFIS